MSIGSVIEHISGRDDVEEFTVLVREVQVYLKTNDESFAPKLRIKVWKGDLVPEPYTFTVSHYVHTPIQSSPYFVSKTASTEIDAIREAIDASLMFISSAISKGYEPDSDWMVVNEDY
ncbi:TPA: hypothetical protein ACOJPH_001006 [Vibrio campbellii]|uniref:hypothetical protein n=1 Tax=Vibrio TaxID=662 RepID=UPI000CE3556E|nr:MULTISPECIES: hypothetical protein [Vibrio]